MCAICPLTFNETNPVYCKCEKKVVNGRVKGETKKIIMKYAFGMDKCIMDIYINTNQNELLTPHEFLLSKKHRIMDEINPLIKKHFTSCIKIFSIFLLKGKNIVKILLMNIQKRNSNQHQKTLTLNMHVSQKIPWIGLYLI